MAKNKPTLPPRKWYSLQQAAEKLTREFNEPVTIDDLLHYYLIDRLELSIYISTSSEVIQISDKVFTNLSLQDRKETLPYSYLDFYLLSELDEKISIPYVFSINKGLENIYQKGSIKITLSDYDESFDNVIFVSGFMNIWDSIGDSPRRLEKIEEMKEKGICLNGFSFLVSPYYDDNYRAVIQFGVNDNCKEDIFITLDNIYILDSDLNAFLQGEKHEKNIDEIIDKQTPPRKEANQTEFIKALIKAHYDTDEPEKVRTLLGKHGKLAKLFARKGIELNVTPETVRNWFKS